MDIVIPGRVMRETRRHSLLYPLKFLAVIYIFFLLPSLAWPAATAVTIQDIDAERAHVEAAQNLDEEQRRKILAQLDEARTFLEQARQVESETAQLKELIEEAPRRMQAAREARTAVAQLSPAAIASWNARKLESELRNRQSRLDEIRARLSQREKALAAYAIAAKNDAAQLSNIRKELESLRATAPGIESSETPAARLLRTARERLLEARRRLLELRQKNLDLLIDLAQAERDLYAAYIGTAQNEIEMLRMSLQRLRENEVSAAQEAARKSAAEMPPALKDLQKNITELVEEQGELLARESSIERRLEEVKQLLSDLENDRERVRHVLEIAGDQNISALLLKRRLMIPTLPALTREFLDHQARINEAVMRQFSLEEKLRGTIDSEARINGILSFYPAEQRAAAREIVEQAWANYRTTLLDLLKTYNRYIAKYSTLETTMRQLLQLATEYRNFIGEQLLWLPSADPVLLMQPGVLWNGLYWLLDSAHWWQLANDFLHTLGQRPGWTIAWLMGLCLLLWLRARALQGLESSIVATRKVRTDSFRATLIALGASLVLALPAPLFLLGLGLLLVSSHGASDFTLTIAAGLQGMGQLLILLRLLRILCRTDGAALTHLRWRATLCKAIRQQILWLLPAAMPLVFLVAAGCVQFPSSFIWVASEVDTQEPGLLAIGLLAFIVLMILFSIAAYRIWNKKGPLLQELEKNNSPWAAYHLLWFPVVLLTPLGLATAALAGYYYTTLFLTAKLGESLWYIFGLVLMKDSLYRWLYVTQRRLRFEEILQRREGQRAANADSSAVDISDEESIDYVKLSDRAQQLVSTIYTLGILLGFWWIWSDIIPALRFLDEVQLPITTSIVADGSIKEVPVTVADMLAGLLFGALTLFAARNLPGLLELSLLQRLPLSRASRYAITTLTQYLVALIGLFITFKALGFQWSSIQWLVAALSVGLGFGLQEIVANFVSGIILLFEQPLRVGDVVTIDGVSGTVSRIKIRATTIVNWDRQELVIPNKTFITGQLINWTLSDTVIRILITVGVAYGSDTRHAMSLMHAAAEENPKVLSDPGPSVTFEGFGDNSLTLILRAYIEDVDERMSITTALHQSINDKLQEAGIVIAFPQRDVHLDTARPLEVVLHHAGHDATP